MCLCSGSANLGDERGERSVQASCMHLEGVREEGNKRCLVVGVDVDAPGERIRVVGPVVRHDG